MCLRIMPRIDPLTFRWMYKENWEVKAEIFMAAEKMGNTVVIYDLLTSNNWYYCWGKDSSKVISLGSSDRLTQNVIANKSIASYHPAIAVSRCCIMRRWNICVAPGGLRLLF